MNQIVTNPKNSKTIMQVKNHKLKVRLAMRTAFLALCAVLFALPVQAAEIVKMKNGSVTVPTTGEIQFYDSGGPDIAYPEDPNDINWMTWYQHNEEYHLTFMPADDSKGIQFAFDYLRVNNDFLRFYEGETVSADKLIAEFTNQDYSNDPDHVVVMSHGPVTVWFKADGSYRDRGWSATVTLIDWTSNTFKPAAPAPMMAACNNSFCILPTVKGTAIGYTTTKIYYTYAENGVTPMDPTNIPSQEYEIGSWIDAESMTFPVTVKAIAYIDGKASEVATQTFTSKITNPTFTEEYYTQNVTANTIDVETRKPEGLNDTYYVRYIISANQEPGDPAFWPNNQYHEIKNPGGTIDYTNPGLTARPFYVHMVIRGTVCPDNFSVVQTVKVEDVYAPKPEIVFQSTGDTIKCSLQEAIIYYTTDGSDPNASSSHATVDALNTADGQHVVYYYIVIPHVSAGTTVKAMTVKTGYHDSDIAYAVYSEGSSVNPTTGIVLLDDREDHSWAYYSMGGSDNPVHSLNPKDVKITYFGNGIVMTGNTDYTNGATTGYDRITSGVAVGVDAPENQFVYLKTLENENSEGTSTNYPYTTIPNPFSKRPTYGTPSGNMASFTGWRGFQGWRVKDVRGGSIGYNIGDIIPAETLVNFQPTAEYGMEVEFEAVWARAYLATDRTTTLNGGSYERNFYVLTGAIDDNIASPGTVSRYYPNGTTDGNNPATSAPSSTQTQNLSALKLSVDTKFEYIALRGTSTVIANNHYLCFGRGINKDASAARVAGIDQRISGNTNYSNLDYTIRMESGNYDRFVFVRNGTATVTGRYIVKAIMGCDYDRARSDNESLLVSSTTDVTGQSNTNGSFFFSTGVTFSNPNNANEKTFDCVIKSGSYQPDLWRTGSTHTNLNDGQYNRSLYCGPNSGSSGYPGVRYVTIEGGEFASMNGGRGSAEESHASQDVIGFYARIKNGFFHGSVFGGAADNNTRGGRSIIITGGTILGWVAGGGNGTGTGESDAMANTIGNSYIYVGGNAVIGSTGNNVTTINETLGGQVFGAGRGKVKNNGTSQTASVINSNVVIADNAIISSGDQANGGNVYGGGNLGTVTTSSNVYILGGTIQNHVFGGAYGNGNTGAIPVSNVIVKGGSVNGSVYGGSNSNGTVTNSNVTMSGGEAKNVFGGGLGANTTIGNNATVAYSGGTLVSTTSENPQTHEQVTVDGNVYGGGQLGKVNGSTFVTISGGNVRNVFGAGLGAASTSASDNANIGQNTNVTVTGGTIQNVFGGGENGSVAYTNGNAATYASTVTINGGTISENVYGGGSKGFSQANTFVNILDGMVEGDVFGGALGLRNTVYVGGLRTVNVVGGTVSGSVYGGSQNADDAITLNNTSTDYTTVVNRVNVAGGHIVYQVFAAGFFGNTYGSVYAFIGKDAITGAPKHMTLAAPYTSDFFTPRAALYIEENVWAGGDFGSFDGTAFGTETVEGYSHIYVDGNGYDTESNNAAASNYMRIGKSLFGCGTSCYAGKLGRDIYVRNYGKAVANASYNSGSKEDPEPEPINEPYTMATRSLYSIQFANNLIIDNSNINLLGQGRVNSLTATETYSLYNFPTVVRVTNASGLFLSAPADQIKKFGSYTCDDVYTATDNDYTKVEYGDLPTTGKDNKIRVNGGAYVNVYYTNAYGTGKSYGELEGFFYMMTEDLNNTCAYARPKTGGYTNPTWTGNDNDGGFVSYHAEYNIFNANGVEVTSDGIQMAYENHTTNLNSKIGEEYFRIWRYGGIYSHREGVLNAIGKTAEGYSTASCTIELPASKGAGSYYVIKKQETGNFTTINYGSDVLTVNGGCYGSTSGSDWMYFAGVDASGNYVTGQASTQTNVNSALGYIDLNTNANFGLVAVPQGAFVATTNPNENLLICEEADVYNASVARWNVKDTQLKPEMGFMLTYNNHITANMSWDPVTITVQQYTSDGKLVDEVEIELTIKTTTSIDQTFSTKVFATMRGEGNKYDSYTAKVVLPEYTLFVDEAGSPSHWSFVEYDWDPESGFANGDFVSGTNYYQEGQPASNHEFSMEMAPSENFDYTMGWDSWKSKAKDIKTLEGGYQFGYVLARKPFAFDFTIHYNGEATCQDRAKLGTLTVTLHFDNYAAGGATHEQNMTIDIEVYRIGKGENWFLDGVNGNHFYSGHKPNAAKKTLQRIVTDSDYMPGDNIFVVNTVTNNSGVLDWNGEDFEDGVVVYRYPGGHTLETSTDSKIAFQGWSTYNPNNTAFQGKLLDVKSQMNMHGITLDGAYGIVHDSPINTNLVPDASKYLDPNSPLINVAQGAILSVYGKSALRWNFSTTDGGAIYNAGTVNFYGGSTIKNNAVLNSKNGGGVYLDSEAKLQLSDLVTIIDNWQNPTLGSKDPTVSGTDNNVYLKNVDSWVTVGTASATDIYVALNDQSKIGVTKGTWGDEYYTPVAYSDGGLDNYLQNILANNIITDDQHKYEVVSLNNTNYDPSTDWLYFVGTWVTAVTSMPNGYNASAIDTPEELAWAISVASGYNNQTAAPNTEFTLTGDIDMDANIWVPIGSNGYPYTGKFNGNGHVVTGLRSPMNEENMGMFGIINGAQITDLVAQANFAGGTMRNIGTVVGKMTTGLLSNVEAAGTLTGTNNTENIGGLVGHAEAGTIHSAFAVNTMTGGNNTVMGGLVGTNKANLYNSYANTTMTGTTATKGGLVGVNNGEVENCYAIVGEQTFPAFAYTNNGTIAICYADKDNGYVNSGLDNVSGHGNYGGVQSDIKHLDYMYRDNLLTKNLNTYVGGEGVTSYVNNHIPVWNGMLSALNQWVRANPKHLDKVTPWNRPINNAINGDLPILAFPKDQSLATLNSDGKFLQYSTGLDNLLEDYTEPSGIFVYGAVTGVQNVPANENVKVTINEDAVLLQADNAGDFKATVGITFDNSDHGQHAIDNQGHTLTYDWHMMSTPLQDAAFGTTYYPDATLGYGQPVDIKSMVNGYFPNNLPMEADNPNASTMWDFYTYYEPEYHWINFKRSINNHWHYDVLNHTHPRIEYEEDDQTNGVFTPGKGYMMAISKDTYMNSTGILNNNGVNNEGIKINITNKEPEGINFNAGWNLVGNPYQAYLDIDVLGVDIFAYDADQNLYAPYTKTASENPAIVSQYVHPHQAFFVYSANEEGSLTFTKNMATTENTPSSYFRGEKVNYPLVNIFAENDRGNRDMTVIEFNRPEIGGVKEIQGLRNANFHIAAHLEGQGYGLLFAPEGTDRVPVRFYTNENDTFTLTWSTYNGDFSSLLLVDNMTGTITDMLRSDHYTFDATTDDYASRFYITFAVTDVEEYNEGDNDFAWFDGSEWVINGKGNLDVVDVLGRTIYSTRLTNDQNRVNLNNVAKGVYMLRVSEGTSTKVQKVVVR